ncbi:MAG: hypothetical protein MUF00_01705 [Gemmatimonadaceae bacterium]|jgi:hypothetical protein|nr:hypothetical protein [Gemmatimonadaceae bacterium]
MTIKVGDVVRLRARDLEPAKHYVVWAFRWSVGEPVAEQDTRDTVGEVPPRHAQLLRAMLVRDGHGGPVTQVVPVVALEVVS